MLCDGNITEIQTVSNKRFGKKIRYYLENTGYTVTVVIPLVCKKKIIRADRETGEVKYTRRSPLRIGVENALPHIYYIRDMIKDARLEVHVVLVEAEEYRYSERMRYRKKGRYDNDLCPVDILREYFFCGAEDYRMFLPKELEEKEFDVSEYSRHSGLRGMDAYSALNILISIGLLEREKNGNKYVYRQRK